MDFNIAFLKGELDEKIYVNQLEGYIVEGLETIFVTWIKKWWSYKHLGNSIRSLGEK